MNVLNISKQQVLKTMTDGGIVLAHATAARMVAVHTLTPASRDPVRHLQEAHAQARTHLARLTVHDPSHEIPSFMTNELFSRLTDAQPRPLTPPAGVGRYTYTPRKALRRVLDHALDHLNQIDQWLAWQREGVVPAPTDGWVGSSVTLPGDLLPISSSDLDAWLWRIDQAPGSSDSTPANSPKPNSTGSRPTAVGPSAACCITLPGRNDSTQLLSTRPFSATTLRIGTRRLAGASTRPCGQ
jgi:hypothetical protein